MPQISGKIIPNVNFSVSNLTPILMLLYCQWWVWNSCPLIWMALNLKYLIWLYVYFAWTLFSWRNGLGPSCTRLYTHLYIWSVVWTALYSWLTPALSTIYRGTSSLTARILLLDLRVMRRSTEIVKLHDMATPCPPMSSCIAWGLSENDGNVLACSVLLS